MAVEPEAVSSISPGSSVPQAASQRVARRTVAIRIEFTLPAMPLLRDGRLYWWRCRGATLRKPNGQPTEPLTSGGQGIDGGKADERRARQPHRCLPIHAAQCVNGYGSLAADHAGAHC